MSYFDEYHFAGPKVAEAAEDEGTEDGGDVKQAVHTEEKPAEKASEKPAEKKPE